MEININNCIEHEINLHNARAHEELLFKSLTAATARIEELEKELKFSQQLEQAALGQYDVAAAKLANAIKRLEHAVQAFESLTLNPCYMKDLYHRDCKFVVEPSAYCYVCTARDLLTNLLGYEAAK